MSTCLIGFAVSFKNVALQEICDTMNFDVNYKAQSRSPGFYTAKIIRSRELFISNKSWPFLVFSWNIPLSFIRFYEAAGIMSESAIQYLCIIKLISFVERLSYRQEMNELKREEQADKCEPQQTPSHCQAWQSLKEKKHTKSLLMAWESFSEWLSRGNPTQQTPKKSPPHLARGITTTAQKRQKSEHNWIFFSLSCPECFWEHLSQPTTRCDVIWQNPERSLKTNPSPVVSPQKNWPSSAYATERPAL